MALIGACLAALVVFIINWIYKKDFWKEIKESLKISKGDHELGEVELSRMVNHTD